MRRRKLLQGTLVMLLAERLGLSPAWAAGAKLPPAGLHRMTGDVRVNSQPARQGMPIQPGDTVTTGVGAEAIYIIGQDAYLQRENSVVTQTGDLVKRGLRVVTGKLLSVFGKGEKRIATPTATIGIRGTGCYIEAASDRVYFCLCYGVADISLLADPGHIETIETQHHDQPLYLHTNGSQMMVPAEVINHRDSELVLLESLVGRIPPFSGTGAY